MRKLIAAFALTLLAAVFFALPVYASDIRVTVDGRQVNFPDAQPIIISGRTLVPMRGVFEYMGFVGDWNPITETSTLMRTGMVVSVRRGDAFFTVNGMQQFPEVPPQLLGGRFMIPLRAVAESTGANVSWNENARTVIITTGAQPPRPPVPTPAPPRPPVINTVSQAGTLTAGTAGTVNFTVTTQNLPNGSYQLSLLNSPAGITLHSTNLIVNGNMGTLRLNGSNATQQGTFNMTVSLNLGRNRGSIYQNLTLVISPQQAPYISVGNQINSVTQGTSGAATFVITTQNLPNGNYSVSATGNWPQGITLASNNVAITNGSGNLTVNVASNVAANTYPVSFVFTVSGAGVGQPVSFTRQINVIVSPPTGPQFTLNVGNQTGSVTQGAGGSVSFPITTNLPNGNYSISASGNWLQGITLASSNVAITNGSGSLTVNVASNAAAGTHPVNLVLTVGGAVVGQPRSFTRTIHVNVSPPGPQFTLNVGNQTGSVNQGTGGSVSFPITTNLPNGNYSVSVTGWPQGITLASNSVAITNGSGSLTVNVASNVAAGPYPANFVLTVSGAVVGQPRSFTRPVTVNVSPSQQTGQQFTISASVTSNAAWNGGAVTITVDGQPVVGSTVTVQQGQLVTLWATADPGWTFNFWSEGGVAVGVGQSQFSFAATQNRSIAAYFIQTGS